MEPELLSMKWNVCVLVCWIYLLVPCLVTEKELERGIK